MFAAARGPLTYQPVLTSGVARLGSLRAAYGRVGEPSSRAPWQSATFSTCQRRRDAMGHTEISEQIRGGGVS